MSYPKETHRWSAGRIYAVGDVVRAKTSNILAFKCVTPGTSGDTEPVFPNQIGLTAQDNEVEWLAFEPLAEELLKLAPTAVIDLFEVELTEEVNGVEDTLRYHAGKNGLTEEPVRVRILSFRR